MKKCQHVVNNSSEFDAKSVVYRYSQRLPAANMAFIGLHRDMPEKKLDLLELASRFIVNLQYLRLDIQFSLDTTSYGNG